MCCRHRCSQALPRLPQAACHAAPAASRLRAAWSSPPQLHSRRRTPQPPAGQQPRLRRQTCAAAKQQHRASGSSAPPPLSLSQPCQPPLPPTLPPPPPPRQPPNQPCPSPHPLTPHTTHLLGARGQLDAGDASVGVVRHHDGIVAGAARKAAAVARLLLHVADDGTLGHVAHLDGCAGRRQGRRAGKRRGCDAGAGPAGTRVLPASRSSVPACPGAAPAHTAAGGSPA